MIVLPVRIIMSPTCSSKFFVGKNALSATARTTWVSSREHDGASGHAARATEEYVIARLAYNLEPSLATAATCLGDVVSCAAPWEDRPGQVVVPPLCSRPRARQRLLQAAAAAARSRT